MKELTKLGFRITQVFQGDTTLVNPTTKMIVEVERNESTGAYEASLFDESETLVFTGSCSADVANYIEGK